MRKKTEQELSELLRELPPDLQREVVDFARFLLKSWKGEGQHGKMKLSWFGALEDVGKEFTSLELQRKALDWWGD